MNDTEFGHWMAGFTDGEGCFYCRVTKPRRGNPAPDIEPAFSIILRDDDRQILEEIIAKTGWKARLRTSGEMTNKQGIRSNPRVQLEVRRTIRCLAVVAFFDRYPLRAKKRRDFETWRQIVLEMASRPRGNKWIGPRDKTRVLGLIESLKTDRIYR